MIHLLHLFLLLVGALAQQSYIAPTADFEEFALAARPYFHFSRALNYDTCWPSKATSYNGTVVPAAELSRFPNAEKGCPLAMSSFPIYWTARRCAATEIRVAYNVFFKKDGFKFADTEVLGHAYDWERIIVQYDKMDSGRYKRTKAFLSQKDGYQEIDWADLETSDEDDLTNPGTNKNHPSVYLTWAKHWFYQDKKEAPIHAFDELTSVFIRNDIYTWFNSASELISVMPSTELWTLFDAYDWGKADTDPTQTHRKMCSVGDSD